MCYYNGPCSRPTSSAVLTAILPSNLDMMLPSVCVPASCICEFGTGAPLRRVAGDDASTTVDGFRQVGSAALDRNYSPECAGQMRQPRGGVRGVGRPVDAELSPLGADVQCGSSHTGGTESNRIEPHRTCREAGFGLSSDECGKGRPGVRGADGKHRRTSWRFGIGMLGTSDRALLFRLEVRKLDHLAPLLSFVRDDLGELGNRQ